VRNVQFVRNRYLQTDNGRNHLQRGSLLQRSMQHNVSRRPDVHTI
jgi:hypothetical protein